MNRSFLVDDMDLGIQYTGPWAVADGASRAGLGYFGPPYNATLHGINTHGTISFKFTGDSVRALAGIDGHNDTSLNPVWSCYVDGVQIPSKDPPTSSINNWVLCETDTIQFGPHQLLVNVTSKNEYDFWFDQIQYTEPVSATDSLNGRTLYVGDSDPGIQYGPGWQPLKDIAHMTQSTGASMNFQFNGTSLTWYIYVQDTSPGNESLATYTIDSQNPVSFFLGGPSHFNNSLYNQIAFKTPQLFPGPHTLKVVHQGNDQTTPLVLDHLQIEGVQSTPSLSPAAAPAALTGAKHRPVGAIVGGVVGGIVVVLLLVLIYLICRKRDRRRVPMRRVASGSESIVRA